MRKCIYVSHACIRFVIWFFFLCNLRTPWANNSAAFPEKVPQCHNAAMPRSGKNTATKEQIQENILHKSGSTKFQSVYLLVAFRYTVHL